LKNACAGLKLSLCRIVEIIATERVRNLG